MMRGPTSLLLVSAIMLGHHALAKNQRHNNMKIPQQQIKEPENLEGRKLFNLECTLMIKVLHSSSKEEEEEGRQYSEEIPECLLPGNTLPSRLINMPLWLSDKFANREVVSSVDSLKLSEALIFDGSIYIPSDVETSFVKAPEDRKRRLLSGRMRGDRTVMAIRVSNQGQDELFFSKEELANNIFGNAGDTFTLASRYAECTNNQLTFSAGSGIGVVDAELALDNDMDVLVNGALDATNLRDAYDHVMVCLPDDTVNSNGSLDWYAWAYVNSYLSVHKGLFCTLAFNQVHQIGSNLNFANSLRLNWPFDPISDPSCMMGDKFLDNSFFADDGLRVCFAGPKINQGTWFMDRWDDLTNCPDCSFRGKLYGIDAYENSSPGDAVVIRYDWRFYMTYNLATGINSGAANTDIANKVLIHSTQSNDPYAYSPSMLENSLAAGQGSATITGLLIDVLSTGPEYAEVEIYPWSSSPTPAPTPSPTTGSTPNPTPMPTPSPTTGSTPNPTPMPTPSPTTGNNPNPTPMPTPSPTTGNNPNPTPMPSTTTPPPTTPPSPSPIDDDDDSSPVCEDDSTFFFEKKNGKKKFCNWFGKRKARCYKKPGAIDACPVSCNLCDKTNFKICTDTRMRKKACKAASMCRWNKNSIPKQCEVL